MVGMAVLEVIIAGARGAGLKVVQILEDSSLDLKLIGFIDDDQDLWETDFFGYPVFGGPSVLSKAMKGNCIGAICPIGDPVNRWHMISRLRGHGVEFPCAVHPSAQISARAKVGCGNIFSQNVVIQAGVSIGNFNAFNIGAIVGPLATVRNFCTVNAVVMIASESVVNDFCYIGMGAKVLQRNVLATGTIVGANAFVNKASEPWSTVVGLPAREIKRREDPFLECT